MKSTLLGLATVSLRRDFLYAETTIRAIRAAAEQENEQGERQGDAVLARWEKRKTD